MKEKHCFLVQDHMYLLSVSLVFFHMEQFLYFLFYDYDIFEKYIYAL